MPTDQFDDMMTTGGGVSPETSPAQTVQPVKTPQVKIVQVGGRVKTVNHERDMTLRELLEVNDYRGGEFEVRVNGQTETNLSRVVRPGEVQSVYLLQRVKGN